ncbi:MAG: hypothetical protein NVSMB51_12910 [Solirubrobacteraceae bacterium]
MSPRAALAAGLIAFALILLVVLDAASQGPRRASFFLPSEVVGPPIAAPLLHTWQFANAKPGDWSAGPGVAISTGAAGDGVSVVTPRGLATYALSTPTVFLAPGHYQLNLHGSVLQGGIALGVVNLTSSNFLGITTYSAREAGAANSDLAIDFDVVALGASKVRPVQFTLSSWSNEPRPSRWKISRIELRGGKGAAIVQRRRGA